MSYSFNVRAATKAEASMAVQAKLEDVAANQPIHEHDRAATLEVVHGFLALIGDPAEGNDLSVSVHGSCWHQDGVFRGVSVGVDISHQPPVAAD